MSSKQNALGLPVAAMTELRAQLPAVAAQTVTAIVAEVPGYADAFEGRIGAVIEQSVAMALAGFLRAASRPTGSDPGTPLQPALDGAYALGRGEAQSGRTTDSLLAAYRVGARESWREWARIAVAADTPAEAMARFAELVFAFIDELSAASIIGHRDEIASNDRVQQRYRDRLTRSLLAGEPADVLTVAAGAADWPPARTLTSVLLPLAGGRGLRLLSDPRILQLSEELPHGVPGEDLLAILIPDLSAAARIRLKTTLEGRNSVVGPTRPWQQVQSSYVRALRLWRLGITQGSDSALDTEEHLVELVITADPDALADLRSQVLAPIAALKPGPAEKATETLRTWLLHQGRRDDMAAAMFVHPQTVRYRMGQLRDLYGERLADPELVLAASIALGGPAPGRP